MNPKLKKIIAREGLVIISVILVSLVVLFTPIFQYRPAYKMTRDYYAEEIEGKNTPKFIRTTKLSEVQKSENSKSRTRIFGVLILFFGYPFYWLTRFILWAVKTLKGR